MSDYELLRSSSLFDDGWYRRTYQNKAGSLVLRLWPVLHYLRNGAVSRWSPSPCFDADWYLSRYPDVESSRLNPLVHFLRHGYGEGRLPRPLQAAEWDPALWGGDELAALPALWSLQQSSDTQEASYAAWCLGRWHARRGEWREVLDAMAPHRSTPMPLPGHHATRLLLADALRWAGSDESSVGFLRALIEKSPNCGDLSLAYANALRGGPSGEGGAIVNDVSWLEPANVHYRRHGLWELTAGERSRPPTLDNLIAQPRLGAPVAVTADAEVGPIVSVIVPAFNVGGTLATALEGLRRQSWRTLDVIVVDDGSADNTARVADEVAAVDPRFRVIRLPRNSGAYAARNVGLRVAKGELITVHDSDDWSHPQKIAMQVAPLRESRELVATVSHWVRATPDLMFGGWESPEGWMGWVHRNVSSLMLRRAVFDRLGYWDRVKCSADTEYYYRILSVYGERAVREVLSGVPLSFGRYHTSSLTQRGETNIFTVFGGMRKDYHEAYRQWHRQAAGPGSLYLEEEPADRPFYAPESICLR